VSSSERQIVENSSDEMLLPGCRENEIVSAMVVCVDCAVSFTRTSPRKHLRSSGLDVERLGAHG